MLLRVKVRVSKSKLVHASGAPIAPPSQVLREDASRMETHQAYRACSYAIGHYFFGHRVVMMVPHMLKKVLPFIDLHTTHWARKLQKGHASTDIAKGCDTASHQVAICHHIVLGLLERAVPSALGCLHHLFPRKHILIWVRHV